MNSNLDSRLQNLSEKTGLAVSSYWNSRGSQKSKQEGTGFADQGLRSAVTGGAQMDGFINILSDLIIDTGISADCIYTKKAVEIPGFFRPTKEWDLLVVKDKTLLVAIEAKSQAGPSFGNNFNNRTEEAIGSAIDLWTAYRENAYLTSHQPFLGYLFLLEECGESLRPVKVRESHFNVFPEFVGASYRKRYEIFCRKLVLERHYTAATFITSTVTGGVKGQYSIPADDLSFERFVKILVAHLGAME